MRYLLQLMLRKNGIRPTFLVVIPLLSMIIFGGLTISHTKYIEGQIDETFSYDLHQYSFGSGNVSSILSYFHNLNDIISSKMSQNTQLSILSAKQSSIFQDVNISENTYVVYTNLIASTTYSMLYLNPGDMSKMNISTDLTFTELANSTIERIQLGLHYIKDSIATSLDGLVLLPISSLSEITGNKLLFSQFATFYPEDTNDISQQIDEFSFLEAEINELRQTSSEFLVVSDMPIVEMLQNLRADLRHIQWIFYGTILMLIILSLYIFQKYSVVWLSKNNDFFTIIFDNGVSNSNISTLLIRVSLFLRSVIDLPIYIIFLINSKIDIEYLYWFNSTLVLFMLVTYILQSILITKQIQEFVSKNRDIKKMEPFHFISYVFLLYGLSILSIQTISMMIPISMILFGVANITLPRIKESLDTIIIKLFSSHQSKTVPYNYGMKLLKNKRNNETSTFNFQLMVNLFLILIILNAFLLIPTVQKQNYIGGDIAYLSPDSASTAYSSLINDRFEEIDVPRVVVNLENINTVESLDLFVYNITALDKLTSMKPYLTEADSFLNQHREDFLNGAIYAKVFETERYSIIGNRFNITIGNASASNITTFNTLIQEMTHILPAAELLYEDQPRPILFMSEEYYTSLLGSSAENYPLVYHIINFQSEPDKKEVYSYLDNHVDLVYINNSIIDLFSLFKYSEINLIRFLLVLVMVSYYLIHIFIFSSIRDTQNTFEHIIQNHLHIGFKFSTLSRYCFQSLVITELMGFGTIITGYYLVFGILLYMSLKSISMVLLLNTSFLVLFAPAIIFIVYAIIYGYSNQIDT